MLTIVSGFIIICTITVFYIGGHIWIYTRKKAES